MSNLILDIQRETYAALNPEAWAVIENAGKIEVKQVKYLSFRFDYDCEKGEFVSSCTDNPFGVFMAQEQAVEFASKTAREHRKITIVFK